MELHGTKHNLINSGLASTFQILSIALLSLLVPLSIVLLSCLSFSNYYLVTTVPIRTETDFSSPFTIHILRYVTLNILYIIILSLITITLIKNLFGELHYSVFQPRIYVRWIVLFMFQASILVIEGNVSIDIDIIPLVTGQERCTLMRVLFFLGLHEVTLMWFRLMVKPVVDDTIFKAYKEERWPERATVAAAFGLIWWWKLRNKFEGLVVVAEAKQKQLIGLEGLDFVNWWIYYLCVGIGMAGVLRGLFWALKKLMVKMTRKGL